MGDEKVKELGENIRKKVVQELKRILLLARIGFTLLAGLFVIGAILLARNEYDLGVVLYGAALVIGTYAFGCLPYEFKKCGGIKETKKWYWRMAGKKVGARLGNLERAVVWECNESFGPWWEDFYLRIIPHPAADWEVGLEEAIVIWREYGFIPLSIPCTIADICQAATDPENSDVLSCMGEIVYRELDQRDDFDQNTLSEFPDPLLREMLKEAYWGYDFLVFEEMSPALKTRVCSLVIALFLDEEHDVSIPPGFDGVADEAAVKCALTLIRQGDSDDDEGNCEAFASDVFSKAPAKLILPHFAELYSLQNESRAAGLGVGVVFQKVLEGLL